MNLSNVLLPYVLVVCLYMYFKWVMRASGAVSTLCFCAESRLLWTSYNKTWSQRHFSMQAWLLKPGRRNDLLWYNHGIMCMHPTDCIPRDHVYTPHWLHTTGSCVYTPLIAYHGIMCIHRTDCIPRESCVYTPLIAYHGIMCIHPTDCIPRESCVYTPLIAYHGNHVYTPHWLHHM